MRAILVRALHPPVRDRAFWFVQLMVVFWAVIHITIDLRSGTALAAFPAGVPIDLLLIPVGYAALHYGLSGSAATAMWSVLLWIPDLVLPDNEGHSHQDLVQLTVVMVVALFVGLEIERAHLERARAEAAEADRRAAELHYRQLFTTNASPIALVDARGVVAEINPAAYTLWGDVVRSRIDVLLGVSHHDIIDGHTPRTVTLAVRGGDERTYRLSVSRLEAVGDGLSHQIVLEDITEERRSESEARAWAVRVLKAQEDERRRIAREIHDDPLQRLLQLARRVEFPDVERTDQRDHPSALVREELLDIVGLLRDVTRGLHPAGLDQHGLVAAVRGLLIDIEIEHGLASDFTLDGEVTRGAPDAEVGIFRIVQEAVRNAVHHSKASHLQVDLAFDDADVALRITDNGCGFNWRDVEALEGTHLGIMSMRERATLLGGHCTIRSAPECGTIVEARVPLQPVARDSAHVARVN